MYVRTHVCMYACMHVCMCDILCVCISTGFLITHGLMDIYESSYSLAPP